MPLKPDLDAEDATVGSILLSPNCIQIVREHVSADSFTQEPHRLIFRAACSMHDAGKVIDSLTLKDELKQRGDLDRVGGVTFLGDLSSHIPTAANVQHYAAIVAEYEHKHNLRTLLRASVVATSNGETTASIISNLLSGIEELGVRQNDAPQRTDVAELLSKPPPDMEYLIEGVLPRGVLCGCDAQGGAGKSMLAQILVTSICTGRTLLQSFKPTGTMRVLWIESEDPPDEIARRFGRIIRAFDLTPKDCERIAENLTLYASQAFALNRVEHGVVVPTERYRWLVREVERVQPDLIILDPRSHFFAGDENSNADVAAFMNLMKALTTITDTPCSVWTNHHVAKMRETEATSASGRGASAARDATRALWSLTPLSASECAAAGIETASGFVKLEQTKSNWSPLGDGPIYLRRLQGECGGVLVETDMRKMRAEADNARLDAIAKEFATMIGENRENLTIRDISRTPGVDIRHGLKVKLGNHVTIPAVEQAIEHGARAGYLTIDTDPSKPLGAKIPRQIREANSHE